MPEPTGHYGWTVPESEDSPSGPEQFTELANDIALTVKDIDDRVISNTTNIGTNAQDIATLKNVPYCQVRATAVKSIVTGNVGSAVDFAVEDYDTHGMHDNVTFNSRLTCKLAGMYMFFGGVPFVPNATGKRGAAWYVNGGTTNAPVGSAAQFVVAGTVSGLMCVSAPNVLVRLALNDYVELFAFQDTGAALSTYWGAFYTAYAGCRYVGP